MIFQDLTNIFEVLERKGFMYQRDFGSSTKTIQKTSTNLTEEVQKNAFAGVLQRRFLSYSLCR